MPTNKNNRNAEIRTTSGRRVGSFRSLEDAQQYIENNNLEQVFREPELAGITVTARRPRSFREHLVEGAKNFEETFGLTPKDAAGFMPLVGDAIDLYDIKEAIKNNNYKEAGLLASMLLLPNVVEKGGKAIYKGVKSAAKRAYTTPTKMLGNRSLRSNLKVFNGHKVDRYKRYSNFAKGIRDRLESAHPDYTFDISPKNITATYKHKQWADDKETFQFNNPITNTHHTGNRQIRVKNNESYSTTILDEDILVSPNITRIKYPTARGVSLEHPIFEYEKAINDLIGNNAHIAGSTPIYRRGYVLGAPNDLELVSTERRFPSIVTSLEGYNTTRHGNFGYDFNSRYGINGNPVTTHIINENANGRAVGPIAHEYYSLLYPEEYRKLTEAAIDEGFAKGKRITLDDIELPISAEDLYSRITPEIQERKLLKDLFISDNDKHVARAFQMLTSDNKAVRDKAVQSMREAIGHHFGKDYKLASETYPNLTFDNIEANEQFLKSLGLPPEYAKDPDIMRNIVDRWHIAETTQSRNTFVRKGDKIYLPDRSTMERAARSIYAPYNGNHSGIGGNTVINSGDGGVGGDFGHIMQQRLTLYPEKINTPFDLINQENSLANIDIPIYDEFYAIGNAVRSGKLSEAKGIAKHKSLAEKYDIPAFYGEAYSDNSRYVGNLVEPVAVRTYPIIGGGRGIRPEVGGKGIPRGLEEPVGDNAFNFDNFVTFDNVDTMGTPLTKDLLKEGRNSFRIYNDETNWHRRVSEANKNLDKARHNARNVAYFSALSALGVGTTALGIGVLKGVNEKNRERYITETKKQIKSMSDEELNTLLKDVDKFYKTDYAKLVKEEHQRRIDENTKRYGGRITLSSDY